MDEREFIIQNRNNNPLNAVWYFDTQPQMDRRPLVLMAHGFTGDKFEWGRFPKAAERFVRASFDVLIFDFTGSGMNKRERITLTRQIMDLEDVARHMTNQGYRAIFPVGLSFGGLTLLCSEIPNCRAAVFWAPGFRMKQILGKLRYLIVRFLFLFKKSPLSLEAEKEPILINDAFFKSVFRVDVDHFLKSFTTPALIIQGIEDDIVKPQSIREAFQLMPQDDDHMLIEVEGATHEFDGVYLEMFIQHTLDFIQKYTF